ncbi:hypothetical protein [Paracoccus everestensis]|uniref:hypothetical protein n=1 Tax=Paracoccus everestensis TaxID=2903900 RepID=UPI001F467085|nr:hypothetical protein [Paracoccus everestensis]
MFSGSASSSGREHSQRIQLGPTPIQFCLRQPLAAPSADTLFELARPGREPQPVASGKATDAAKVSMSIAEASAKPHKEQIKSSARKKARSTKQAVSDFEQSQQDAKRLRPVTLMFPDILFHLTPTLKPCCRRMPSWSWGRERGHRATAAE